MRMGRYVWTTVPSPGNYCLKPSIRRQDKEWSSSFLNSTAPPPSLAPPFCAAKPAVQDGVPRAPNGRADGPSGLRPVAPRPSAAAELGSAFRAGIVERPLPIHVRHANLRVRPATCGQSLREREVPQLGGEGEVVIRSALAPKWSGRLPSPSAGLASAPRTARCSATAR